MESPLLSVRMNVRSPGRRERPRHAGADRRYFTRREVAALSAEGRLLIVVENKVYDVTEFMVLDHPGGREVLEAAAGGDASQQFADVGHSDVAQDLMAELFVGRVTEEERRPRAVRAGSALVRPAPPAPARRPRWQTALDYLACACVLQLLCAWLRRYLGW